MNASTTRRATAGYPYAECLPGAGMDTSALCWAAAGNKRRAALNTTTDCRAANCYRRVGSLFSTPALAAGVDATTHGRPARSDSSSGTGWILSDWTLEIIFNIHGCLRASSIPSEVTGIEQIEAAGFSEYARKVQAREYSADEKTTALRLTLVFFEVVRHYRKHCRLSTLIPQKFRL